MSSDYEVGFGKPPRHTRFRKGRSGNPRGRPKGSRNLKTDLMAELRERVVLREGPREIRISKQRALVKAQLAKGIKGDGRAAALIFDLTMRLLGASEDEAAEMPLSAEEQEVLEALERRILDRARRNRSSEPVTAGDAPPQDGSMDRADGPARSADAVGRPDAPTRRDGPGGPLDDSGQPERLTDIVTSALPEETRGQGDER